MPADLSPTSPGTPPPGGDRTLSGPWRAAIATDELHRNYPDVGFDDGDWEPVAVPGHWRSVAAFSAHDGPLLYRTRFRDPGSFGPGVEGSGRADPADQPRRTWLVLDGVFYTSDVWLDGTYIGDTEGYFFPQSFEVGQAMAERAEHTLALEVTCRPEADRTAKRNLTGVFQHWDLLDPDWNPGGIWRPVRLEQTGPVRIRHFRGLCRDANADQATVFVRTVLDAAEAGTVDVVTRLVPSVAGAGTASVVEHHHSQPLAAGENRVEWTVAVPGPQLWWPHSLGDQPLYDLHVEVRIVDGAGDPAPTTGRLSDEVHRVIGLRSVTVKDWIFSINGERLFLKGSNQGPTRMALAEATDEDLARDIDLARDANLDFLRVHGHVSRPAFYEAADAAGMLLWQDMPLQWGYHRSVRRQARRQARELVDLLAHHPSVFVWCGHNEPIAIDPGSEGFTDPKRRRRLATGSITGQVLPSWNKSVLDLSVKRVIDQADGSRPVVPHSGILPHAPQFDGTDTHSYLGWYYGKARDVGTFLRHWPRLGRFVTEFGAQAVPEDASFLDAENWPDLDWDRAERSHSFQKYFMDRFVPAGDFATFEDWRQATQRYQGEVIRLHIEALRRLKYRPCGGFAQFSFADGYPSITWSVLGHDRQPKAGYEALRAACRPVIVVADPIAPALAPGDALGLDVHVVNDHHIAQDDMVVDAHLLWGEQALKPEACPAAMGDPDGSLESRHHWSWQGAIPADSCVRVGTIQAVVPAVAGPLALVLTLGSGHRDPIVNRYSSQIVVPPVAPVGR
jgi:beta-mannosidase